MMRLVRRKFLPIVVVLATVTFAPLSAWADDTTPKVYDGRLEGYGRPVTLDGGGTALSYFLLVGLGLIGLGGLFKNAMRTHLD